MSKELRKKSKANIAKLEEGATGKWLYLSKAGNEPPVLFLSLAKGKIDKAVAEGREVKAKGDYSLAKGTFYLHVKTGKIALATVKLGVDAGFQWEVGEAPGSTDKAPKGTDSEKEPESTKESDDGLPSEEGEEGGSEGGSDEQPGEGTSEGGQEGNDGEKDDGDDDDGLDDFMEDSDELEALLKEQRKGKKKAPSKKEAGPSKEQLLSTGTAKAKARARFLGKQEGSVDDVQAALIQGVKDGDLDAMDYFRALGWNDEDLRDPDFPGDDLLDLDEDDGLEGEEDDPEEDDGLEVEDLAEDDEPELPKKLAKKLKKRTAQQAALVKECEEAATLYQEALRTGADDEVPSVLTRRAKARLVQARDAALAWLEAQAKTVAQARAKKPEDADIGRALDELQKLITALTNVHAERAPDQLGPSETALTEEEEEELRPRIPWVLAGDPLLLTCQERVDQRQEQFLGTVAELRGTLEVLEAQLKDHIFRGLSPSDDMKASYKEGKEALEKLEKERAALLGQVPATLQAIASLDPAEVTDAEKEEVRGVLAKIQSDLIGLGPELEFLARVGRRVRKLAEAKPGDIADQFTNPAHGKIWKAAAKVAIEQEHLFEKGRKTASEAVSYGKDVQKLKAEGKNSNSKLAKLKALEVESAERQKAIFAYAKQAEAAKRSLEGILADTSPEDREEVSAALESLEQASKLQPSIIAQLAAVRTLYQQLSGTAPPGNREPGRPFGIFRSSEVLAAFLTRLSELVAEAEEKAEDLEALTEAPTGSPELEALHGPLRAYLATRILVPKKLAMALRNLDKADAALVGIQKERDPEADADVKRWLEEAESLRAAVEAAQPTFTELIDGLQEQVNGRRVDLGTLPELVNVPTLVEFGIELQKYPAFEEETSALMPELPRYEGSGRFRQDGAPVARSEVRASLQALRAPAKQQLERIRKAISRLKDDLKTLNKRRDRLQPGLDLQEVEQARRQLFLLRESLDTLKSCLKRFIEQGEKLYKKAD